MTRWKPLVTQHLENISRDALETYQDVLRDHIRQRQGIYALYRRGKLYYVGLASDLRARLKTHLRDRHADSWDRFSVYLTIGDGHMKELELLLLRIVSLSGNKVKGRFIKSQNLKPTLQRDLTRRHREESAMLLGSRKQVVKKPPKAMPTRSKITGRRPILARYVQRAMHIRAKYKGQTHRARVRRDGTISYQGEVYNSPSRAAKAVVGHGSNGWVFWTYERSPGDWVSLGHLRR